MDSLKLCFNSMSDELKRSVDLYIEAMHMVSSEYGSSLSHAEFMDKTEEYYCILLEEEEYRNSASA